MKDLKNSMSGGELLLRSLKAQGMDHFLANAGSDFAPIVEAYARVGSGSPDLPEPVIVPHESALVGMAHGYWLATGRPQAAMVHVNVGLANAAMAMINARADDVPVLLMSGRTPLTEHDRPGARRTPIQYGQEQFDQASLVRDVVKWHFELRYPETVPALLSRALAVAKSAPEGPVYLSLPREPLTELTGADVAADPLQAPSRAGAAAEEDIATAAGWLAAAENPLIICQRGDPGGRVAAVLERLKAVALAEATAALLVVGMALIDAYEAIKKTRALLDYDNLIEKAGKLLASGDGVSWVHYKLDGGIDHILVDEAQDTSPAQWQVIKRLAGDFYAGEGAGEGERPLKRTVFAVGDEKQSIYSFQDADPAYFGLMRDHFRAHELAPLDAGVLLLQAGRLIIAQTFLHVEHRGRAHGHAAHALDTRGDDDVLRAAHHRLRGELDRLLAGAALAIDRDRRNTLAQML